MPRSSRRAATRGRLCRPMTARRATSGLWRPWRQASPRGHITFSASNSVPDGNPSKDAAAAAVAVPPPPPTVRRRVHDHKPSRETLEAPGRTTGPTQTWQGVRPLVIGRESSATATGRQQRHAPECQYVGHPPGLFPTGQRLSHQGCNLQPAPPASESAKRSLMTTRRGSLRPTYERQGSPTRLTHRASAGAGGRPISFEKCWPRALRRRNLSTS